VSGEKQKNYLLDFWRDIWIGGKEGNKKKNYFLLALLVLGIILMFSSSFFAPRAKVPAYNEDIEKISVESAASRDTYEKELTESLRQCLEQIDGISKVHVFISFDTSKESFFAQVHEENVRETTENDREGGIREIYENDKKQDYVLLQESGGGEKPLLLKENMPQAGGVLVVADGVEENSLCLKVVRAIQSLLDLPVHRIAVLPLGSN
jgi:stage III sporulation protein AG